MLDSFQVGKGSGIVNDVDYPPLSNGVEYKLSSTFSKVQDNDQEMVNQKEIP